MASMLVCGHCYQQAERTIVGDLKVPCTCGSCYFLMVPTQTRIETREMLVTQAEADELRAWYRK